MLAAFALGCSERSAPSALLGAAGGTVSAPPSPTEPTPDSDPSPTPNGSDGEALPSDLPVVGGVPSAPDDGEAPSDAGEPPASPDASSSSLDRCDVGILDPQNPPRSLQLSGNLGAHDPVIIAAGGRYHYFSTGNGISVKTSPDLLAWRQEPDVFPTTPAWFLEQVPAYEPRNIWAPDISFFGGQYHLYYSVSSFGSNRSCIGHATRASLDTGAWADHEAMFCSNPPGQSDDFNAIDPNVILDEAGAPWLAFGSFWSGIYMLRLDADGNDTGDAPVPLASRGGGAIEAPFIVRRCGFYYLFVSFDRCCQGADSTYNIRVGRSSELLGPYVARDGTPLLEGGGTPVLAAGGAFVGPGHNAILVDGTRAYNVYHAYSATTGASQLRISELVWDDAGWPLSAGP